MEFRRAGEITVVLLQRTHRHKDEEGRQRHSHVCLINHPGHIRVDFFVSGAERLEGFGKIAFVTWPELHFENPHETGLREIDPTDPEAKIIAAHSDDRTFARFERSDLFLHVSEPGMRGKKLWPSTKRFVRLLEGIKRIERE